MSDDVTHKVTMELNPKLEFTTQEEYSFLDGKIAREKSGITARLPRLENQMRGKVHLKVEYHRHKGRSDAANIIDGIADALNKIAYVDDKQIVEIHYHEALGKVDEYWVEIEEVI